MSTLPAFKAGDWVCPKYGNTTKLYRVEATSQEGARLFLEGESGIYWASLFIPYAGPLQEPTRNTNPVPNDPVTHPQHYTKGGIECKDAIKAALTPEEYRGWVKGCVLKYVWREKYKGGDQDIEKAREYLGWLKSQGVPNESN